MKRNLLLLAALCGIIMSVDAQKVNFGVKAGVNISSLGDYEWRLLHDDVEFDAKAGLYAGVFTQIYFFKGLGIETGLFYAQLGGKDKENDYLELYEVTANPSYLQLPVCLVYKFNFGEKFSLYPALGIYGGCGVGGKMKAEGNIGSFDITSEVNYFDDFARRFDFGGTVGLTLQYWKIALGFGYDRSFIRVNKKEIKYEDNAFNSNFRVTLGFVF